MLPCLVAQSYWALGLALWYERRTQHFSPRVRRCTPARQRERAGRFCFMFWRLGSLTFVPVLAFGLPLPAFVPVPVVPEFPELVVLEFP